MDGKSARITTTGHGLTAASYQRHRVQNHSLSMPSFRDLGFVSVTVIGSSSLRCCTGTTCLFFPMEQ